MPHTMLRFPTVKARTGLSRSTIYLRIPRGTFPAPVSLPLMVAANKEGDPDPLHCDQILDLTAEPGEVRRDPRPHADRGDG